MPKGITSELQNKVRPPCSCPQGEKLELATPSVNAWAPTGSLLGFCWTSTGPVLRVD